MNTHFSCHFLALSLLTSGTPEDRIIEISLLRFSRDEFFEPWTRLINPHLLLSKQKQVRTHLSNTLLTQQPDISFVLQEFKKHLKSAPLVIHGSSSQMSLLQEYLTEEDIPIRLCSWRLARQLLPWKENFSLAKIYKHFYLKNNDFIRSQDRVYGTAKIFLKLLELAEQQKMTSIEQLHHLQWSMLPSTQSRFAEIKFPEKPGIFKIKDETKQILYVGKSRNLKETLQRLLRNPFPKAQFSTKLKKMLQKSHSLECELVGHELEAHLQESFYIRQEHPPYNQILSRIRTYSYLKISTEQEVPRLYITDRLSSKGHYFGPFSNRKSLEKIVESLKISFLPSIIPEFAEEEHLPLFEKELSEQSTLSVVSLKQYLHQIGQLLDLLSGKSTALWESLELKISEYLRRQERASFQHWQTQKQWIGECLRTLHHLQKLTSQNLVLLLPGLENETHHLVPLIQGRVHPTLIYSRYQQPVSFTAQKLVKLFFHHQYPLSKPLDPIEMSLSLIIYRWLEAENHDFVVIKM
ncbi:MAG: hypothetical protein AABZ60_00285, partial [Planctomycetota bacterium]